MSPLERSLTLDEIRHLEAFIAVKKQLLSEANAKEVRELLHVQINDLGKRTQALIDQLRPPGEKRVS